MPTYFQVVKQVLDQLYAELPAEGRDEGIAAALKMLEKKYATVLEKGGPNYAADEVKFAYIYRYTTAHADFLHNIIQRSKEVAAFAKGASLVVSCIGGGPGSDILGFVKYLLPIDPKPHLTFFLLDKDQSWSDAWWNLDAILGSDLRTSSNFIPVDVTDPATWKKNKAYRKADIYTLIYFLSEIYSLQDEADDFLRSVFGGMKSGAVLIVIDFQNGDLVNWIENVADEWHLEPKLGADNQEWVIDPEEEKTDLGKYYKKFEAPKLRARLFYRVYVRK
jgi:hypothetical protein